MSTSCNGEINEEKNNEEAALKTATASVLLRSTPVPENSVTVKGPDFNQQLSLHELLESYSRIGFQAFSVGKAIELINKMRKWRLSDEPMLPDETEEYKDPSIRSTTKLTTAGGIEEDFIKCLGPTYLADFELNGTELRKNDKLLEEQMSKGIIWSPSKIINRLGKEINNPESIYYWAYKNNVPVYCPALTDGSLGDMIYFHTFKNPGLIIDIVSDIKSINQQAVFAKKTGVIILGGGIVKHHICNANLMRNGADYAVYINTGQEFDGSDSGARPDEAVSWGKIRMNAEHIKVYADATIVFPLIVAETFAKDIHK
ncbi:deoxyhypusine synthase [Rhizophagus clarus]|uniref:deoxyhypusine synthase n=1 Tax=Rhizophagus clarus TaxID=94130 RepID=A0A8H3LE22_9GLOM|nr:deoxyhypusine synthase [Rhizophagus clarus]